MNYPDGMTQEHWARIDGENHFETCPRHEDHDDVTRKDECICNEIDQGHKDDAAERRAER